jgi:putative ABC transport system substrate-binding protein
MIGRRGFFARIRWAAAGFLMAPRCAQAQSSRLPVVGYLGFSSLEGDKPFVEALRRGLAEEGLVDGQNIRIELRHAGGDVGRIDALIRELLELRVELFIAPGPAAARALHRATQQPIVALQLTLEQFERDLYASLSRPGGRVTGLSSIGEGLSAKRIDLAKQALPGIKLIGIMHNATDPNFREWGLITERDARAQGLDVVRRGVATRESAELDEHFAALKAADVKALMVTQDFMMVALRGEILRSAHAARIAVIGEHRDMATAGALLSYGPDVQDLFRRAGSYVSRILKGAKPADLAIQLPTRFAMVLNLKTASALGLSMPPLLLAQADEVIE